MTNKLPISICIPAYNEQGNIENTLNALLKQQTKNIMINKIVVVSSGSTDNTDNIVGEYEKNYSNIMLITQPQRKGKAEAINAFLQTCADEVIIIESADTV